MMKKTAVAFDIGESYIKIAQRKGSKITVEAVQMPENLIRDGVIQMPNVLTDFLKTLNISETYFTFWFSAFKRAFSSRRRSFSAFNACAKRS